MKNKFALLGAASVIGLSSVANAAIDITSVTAGITDAGTTATTLGAAALGLAVIFMGYKLVKRAISKV
jgi:hypothetical protein